MSVPEAQVTAAVDRSSSEPLHAQIARLLRASTGDGRWATGRRLPAEHDLARTYGVSRSTIRQALAELEHQGLLRKHRGRGSFVSGGHPRTWHIESKGGFLDENVFDPDARVVSRVLTAEISPLPTWACGALGLEVGSIGGRIERLRWVGDDLFLYGINALPEPFAAAVIGPGLENDSIYRRLEQNADVRLAMSRRTIEAVTASGELAELLGVQRGHPLALVDIISWDASGQPVECSRSWVRTDRIRLEVMVVSGSTGIATARNG